jgi:hypothetical protein
MPRSAAGRTIDVLILLAVIATAWRYVASSFEARDALSRPAPRVRVGSDLSELGVAWERADRNIVLAVQTTCLGCVKSLPVYQAVSSYVTAFPGASLVVLGKDPLAGVSSWLSENMVAATTTVGSVNLAAIGVSVTPTILVVDGAGMVTDVLAGVLSDDERAHVFARIAGATTRRLENVRYPRVLEPDGLNALLARTDTIVVDVRTRAMFSRDHRPGAVNIPEDEIRLRGPVELALVSQAIVECPGVRFEYCQYAGEILLSSGMAEVWLLSDRR